MKQNKQEQKLNKIYQKYEHYYQDIMNEGFSQNDYDKIFNDFLYLLSQTRQEAVEEERESNKRFFLGAITGLFVAGGFKNKEAYETLSTMIKALSQEKK